MAKPVHTDWRKDSIPLELIELQSQVKQLPGRTRDKLLPLCDRVYHFVRLQSRLVRIAQDAVDQLQLDTKYLHFDLDATRRERDALRQELEEQ